MGSRYRGLDTSESYRLNKQEGSRYKLGLDTCESYMLDREEGSRYN